MLLTFKKQIDVGIFVIYLALVSISLMNYLIFQVSDSGIWVANFIICVLPGLFIGYCVDFYKYRYFIFSIAIIYLIILYYYVTRYYIAGLNVEIQNINIMGFAYYAIPTVQILWYCFLKNKNIIMGFFSILGIVYLFLCGTRGPILCAVIYILMSLFIGDNNNKATRKKWLIFLSLITLSIILYINAVRIAKTLYPLFVKYHLSTRILQYFISSNSNVSDLSGRKNLYSAIINNINEHPLFGTGIASDREIIGSYSHNIVLEIINSYGILIGFLFVIILVVVLLMGVIYAKSSDDRQVWAILFTSSIIRLIFSFSYLEDINLFILLGFCLRIIRVRQFRNSFAQISYAIKN